MIPDRRGLGRPLYAAALLALAAALGAGGAVHADEPAYTPVWRVLGVKAPAPGEAAWYETDRGLRLRVWLGPHGDGYLGAVFDKCPPMSALTIAGPGDFASVLGGFEAERLIFLNADRLAYRVARASGAINIFEPHDCQFTVGTCVTTLRRSRPDGSSEDVRFQIESALTGDAALTAEWTTVSGAASFASVSSRTVLRPDGWISTATAEVRQADGTTRSIAETLVEGPADIRALCAGRS